MFFQLQVGLQANVPQPYDDDEDGADHNTTVDDIEAALTDLQVNTYLINVSNQLCSCLDTNSNDKTRFQMSQFSNLAIA